MSRSKPDGTAKDISIFTLKIADLLTMTQIMYPNYNASSVSSQVTSIVGNANFKYPWVGVPPFYYMNNSNG